MSYELDFLRVGENTKAGDAIAFRFWDPDGTEDNQIVCIVDGGYTQSGEDLKNHINKYYNTNAVDLVISTHPDSDHSGGLKHILEKMEVKRLWLHRPWHRTEGMADLFKDGRITDNSIKEKLKDGLESVYELEQIAISKQIEIKDHFQGLTEFDDSVYVLGPSEEYYDELIPEFRCTPEPKAEEQKSLIEKVVAKIKEIFETWTEDNLTDNSQTSAENNSSVILLLNLDGKLFLLTADAGIQALENAIDELEAIGLTYKDLHFIQIPHHGSKRNVGPNILNRMIGPVIGECSTNKYSCVSVAKEENTKHPAKAVLNAFRRRGVAVCSNKTGTYCKHSIDLPVRDGYSTAKVFEFYTSYEIEE